MRTVETPGLKPGYRKFITYNDNWEAIEEKYYFNNNLHSTTGPSVIRYKDCSVIYEAWYDHGVIGPVVISHDGCFMTETHYQNGTIHNSDGPAIVEYENGVPILSVYYKNGTIHNSDGPAVIRYVSGCKSSEEWYIDGDLVEDVPGKIEYYRSGNKKAEYNYKNSTLSDLNNPSVIEYHYSGYIEKKFWYLDNDIHGSPGIIIYNEDGDIIREESYVIGKRSSLDKPACCVYPKGKHSLSGAVFVWFRNGKKYRIDEPAYIEYDSFCNLKLEKWYKEDNLHNDNGPAMKIYQEGKLAEEKWYTHDIHVMTICHEISYRRRKKNCIIM